MTDSSIEAGQVIERLGGNAKTAALCEVTPSAVSQWIKNGIPRAQLKFIQAVRPDLFPSERGQRRRKAVK
jgi:predicted transcriptional regulator